MKMKIIDQQKWHRKEYFDFFSKMKSPYFGLTTEVDCTASYEKAKKENYSFFAYYFHKSLVAVNSVEELKMRIIDDQVVLYDKINALYTVARTDGTFGFSTVDFSENFDFFNSELQKEINATENSTGLGLKNGEIDKDLIIYSTIPWISFSGIESPHDFEKKQSVPKIVFGKFNIREGRKYLPISIIAHHGLVDGFHIAKYLEEFQRQLDKI
jgi:chloramphenicol O-acetyltransferase type A